MSDIEVSVAASVGRIRAVWIWPLTRKVLGAGRSRHRGRLALIVIGLFILVSVAAGVTLLARTLGDDLDPRSRAFARWALGDTETRAELVTVRKEPCPDAPFILPAEGFIGLLYGDPRGPYSASRPHQGIDIFSNSEPGVTPVFAAFDGYVTREDDWRSSLIIRVPNDPLMPGRQIWLYYTHMAGRTGNDFIVEAFPPGTRDLFVPRGTLLGFTGNYNGNSAREVWVHLHFSVVLDDGTGRYTNELDYGNTIDPSPYLGMNVNYACSPDLIECSGTTSCKS